MLGLVLSPRGVSPGLRVRVRLWAGRQYASGRLAYYLLPRGQLIPVVAVILLMRLFRTLPRGVRAGWDLGFLR